jgi:hypothetical protein
MRLIVAVLSPADAKKGGWPTTLSLRNEAATKRAGKLDLAQSATFLMQSTVRLIKPAIQMPFVLWPCVRFPLLGISRRSGFCAARSKRDQR